VKPFRGFGADSFETAFVGVEKPFRGFGACSFGRAAGDAAGWCAQAEERIQERRKQARTAVRTLADRPPYATGPDDMVQLSAMVVSRGVFDHLALYRPALEDELRHIGRSVPGVIRNIWLAIAPDPTSADDRKYCLVLAVLPASIDATVVATAKSHVASGFARLQPSLGRASTIVFVA